MTPRPGFKLLVQETQKLFKPCLTGKLLMGVKLKNDQLIIDDNTPITYQNREAIEKLNANAYFSNGSTNRWGRELVAYLCNGMHLDVVNPEPIDLTRNTLTKVLGRLRRIDMFVQKPLEKYTAQDFNGFVAAFMENRLPHIPNSNRKMQQQAIGLYVREFKRLWRIYRQWQIHNSKRIKLVDYEWGMNLRPPKVRVHHEDYPRLTLDQVHRLADDLLTEEYRVRLLLSVNLMGRKCEISNLRFRDVEFRENESVWVKLPNVKKHSTDKVRVELFTYAKTALRKYIDGKNLRNDDLLFPSNDFSFAKNLRDRSQKIYGMRINPKTLRKLGVCIAEQLGYTREDVERIGGWEANSPVIAHYFHRGKGVEVRREADAKVEQTIHKDIFEEVEKVRAQSRIINSENQQLREQLASLADEVKTFNQNKRIYEETMGALREERRQNEELYNRLVRMMDKVKQT